MTARNGIASLALLPGRGPPIPGHDRGYHPVLCLGVPPYPDHGRTPVLSWLGYPLPPPTPGKTWNRTLDRTSDKTRRYPPSPPVRTWDQKLDTPVAKAYWKYYLPSYFVGGREKQSRSSMGLQPILEQLHSFESSYSVSINLALLWGRLTEKEIIKPAEVSWIKCLRSRDFKERSLKRNNFLFLLALLRVSLLITSGDT